MTSLLVHKGDISLKHYLILGKKYLLLDQLYKSILSQQWQNALLWRQTFNKTKGEIKLFKKYLTLAAQGKKKIRAMSCIYMEREVGRGIDFNKLAFGIVGAG